MRAAAGRRARRIGCQSLAAALAVVGAVALARAGSEGPAHALPAPAADAASCEAPAAESADAAFTEALRGIRAGQVEAAGASDAVVLNNRGYNYGPSPGVRFDPRLAQRDAKASGLGH